MHGEECTSENSMYRETEKTHGSVGGNENAVVKT